MEYLQSVWHNNLSFIVLKGVDSYIMGFYIKQIYKRRPCILEICPTGCDEGGYKSMDGLKRLYQWRAVRARVSSKNEYFLAPILSDTLLKL